MEYRKFHEGAARGNVKPAESAELLLSLHSHSYIHHGADT